MGQQVGFVMNHDGVRITVGQLAIVRTPRPGAIEHQQQHVGRLDLLAGTLDAGRLDFVARGAQAGRVGQFNRPTVERRRRRHHVAGRAGRRRNNRPLVSQQRVNQAALAHVRTSRQHHPPGPRKVSPQRRPLQQLSQSLAGFAQFASSHPFIDRPHFTFQRSVKLIEQNQRRASRRRFGQREASLCRKRRWLVLAEPSRPVHHLTANGHQCIDDPPHGRAASVAMNLDRLLARGADDQFFAGRPIAIDNLPAAEQNSPKHYLIELSPAGRMKKLPDQFSCLRTLDKHAGHRAASGRGQFDNTGWFIVWHDRTRNG